MPDLTQPGLLNYKVQGPPTAIPYASSVAGFGGNQRYGEWWGRLKEMFPDASELDLEDAMKRYRFGELTDPSSQYYQMFRDYLGGQLSMATPTINSLLGLQVAMGGDYEASTAIANQQWAAEQAKAREQASQATKQFFLGASGQAHGLLGQLGQSAEGRLNRKMQLDIAGMNQPEWWEAPLQIAAGAAGYALPGVDFSKLFKSNTPVSYGDSTGVGGSGYWGGI